VRSTDSVRACHLSLLSKGKSKVFVPRLCRRADFMLEQFHLPVFAVQSQLVNDEGMPS